MKAVVVYGKGDLRVEEIDDAVCGSDQVLIEMEWGGICGSDVAYWLKGASGTAVLQDPLVLGHEVAGHVADIGGDAAVQLAEQRLEVGAPVAIHPATLVGDYEVPEEIADRTNLWPEVQAGTTVFRRTSRLRSRLRARRRRLAVSSRRYAAAGFWSRSANLPADEVPAALGNIVTREIDYRGSYRFIDEISQALELMAGGVDVTPLMTHEVSIDDAVCGFELAADRSTGSSKVMIRLS